MPIGYPIVTVPLGRLKKNGLPFGLAFMGTVGTFQNVFNTQKYSEPTLIRIMAAYEAAFPPRAVPEQLKKNRFTPQYIQHGGIKQGLIRNWRGMLE